MAEWLEHPYFTVSIPDKGVSPDGTYELIKEWSMMAEWSRAPITHSQCQYMIKEWSLMAEWSKAPITHSHCQYMIKEWSLMVKWSRAPITLSQC